MDDYKIIIYIALGAIYYGYKFFVKKKDENGRELEERQPQPTNQRPAKTWSAPPPKGPERTLDLPELLEELRRQEATRKQPTSLEYESLETIDYDSNPEKAKVDSVNPYIEYRSIDTSTAADTAPRFSEFAIPTRVEHPIRKLFQNKNNIREAFVLGELLKRKA